MAVKGPASSRPLPTDVTIRVAEVADLPALKTFVCSKPGEPWSIAPEYTVQHDVPRWVAAADSAPAVLVAERAGQIVGVIAYRPDHADSSLATSIVLAVSVNHRREFIGFNLKLAALRLSRAAGVVAMASQVDEMNEAMLGCNALFEAGTAPDPDADGLLINTVHIKR